MSGADKNTVNNAVDNLISILNAVNNQVDNLSSAGAAATQDKKEQMCDRRYRDEGPECVHGSGVEE